MQHVSSSIVFTSLPLTSGMTAMAQRPFEKLAQSGQAEDEAERRY
jgi:hypothetical protein